MFTTHYKKTLVPASEVSERIERLRRGLEKNNIEAAIIIYRPNCFYFSGTAQDEIVYISIDSAPILLVKRDFDRAKIESPIARVLSYSSLSEIPKIIKSQLGKLPRLLGIEMQILPFSLCKKIESLFEPCYFYDISAIIKKCRQKKSAFEVEKIKAASDIASSIFEESKNLITVGMTEAELSNRLDWEAKKRGHEGMVRMLGINSETHGWHVLAGKSGCISSAVEAAAGGEGTSVAFPVGGGQKKTAENEPIIIDCVICVEGYLSDQTRTFCVGSVPDEVEVAYNACCSVLNGILELYQPGIICSQLYHYAIELISELNMKNGFLGLPGKKASFLGHGIGLEVNEMPVIGIGQEYPLENDTTIAIEPKIVIPEKGLVGIENTYLIQNDRINKLIDADDSLYII